MWDSAALFLWEMEALGGFSHNVRQKFVIHRLDVGRDQRPHRLGGRLVTTATRKRTDSCETCARPTIVEAHFLKSPIHQLYANCRILKKNFFQNLILH